jgi:hypothetical protein
MKLRPLYSKFLVSICENNYANADTLLESILTEKIKRKVERAAKDEDSDDKCCKKCKKPSCKKKK